MLQRMTKKRVRILVLICTVFGVMSSVEARGRRRSYHHHSYSRHASAAAAAQRQQWIRILQQQVAAARQTLATAESRASMTKAEFDQAMGKLTKVRSEINATHVDVASALKTLHVIETELLQAQSDDSPWMHHLATLEQAKVDSHAVIHRVLGLPERADGSDTSHGMIEMTKLATAQRQLLDADPEYQAAEQRISQAGAEGQRLRKDLLEHDTDWVDASDGVLHARQHASTEARQLNSTAATANSERIELIGEQSIAATARAIIAQGETRLRQLGVKTGGKPVTSKSSRSSR